MRNKRLLSLLLCLCLLAAALPAPAWAADGDPVDTPTTSEGGETADGETTDGETTDGETTDGETTDGEEPSFSINRDRLQMNAGDTFSLKITAENCTVERVVWNSDNNAVAAAAPSATDPLHFGVVSALSPGTAKLTAAVYYGGEAPEELQCDITVSGIAWGYFKDAACTEAYNSAYGVPRLMTVSSGFEEDEKVVYLKLTFYGTAAGQTYSLRQTHPGFDRDLVRAVPAPAPTPAPAAKEGTGGGEETPSTSDPGETAGGGEGTPSTSDPGEEPGGEGGTSSTPEPDPEPDPTPPAPATPSFTFPLTAVAGNPYVLKISSAGDDVGRAFLDLMQGTVSAQQFEFLVWNSAVVTGVTVQEVITDEEGTTYGKDLLTLDLAVDDPNAETKTYSYKSGTLRATVTTNPDDKGAYTLAKGDWGTSNGTEAIASAVISGNTATFTGESPGTFRSYVVAGDYRAVYTVTVSGLSLPATATFIEGGSGTLEVHRYGSAATGELEWSVEKDKEAVLTVDDDGLIKAAKKGKAVVTCTCTVNGIPYSASCTVSVTEPPADGQGGSNTGPGELRGISMLTDPITLDAGKSKNLTAYLVPDKVTGKITWTVTDTSIATCDLAASGDNVTYSEVRITAVAPGETTITAACENKSAYCRVITSGVVLDKTELVLGLNDSAQVGKSLFGDAVSLPGTGWVWSLESEADAKYVRVNPGSGLLTGSSPTPTGKTVTVICSQGNYRATLKVTVLEDTATVIEAKAVDNALPLKGVLADMVGMCGKYPLDHVFSLSVSPSEGVLYYGYVSPNNPGAGVSIADSFYIDGRIEHKQLERIVFIPKTGFTGIATVYFTLAPLGGETIKGILRVTVDPITKICYTSETGESVQLQAEDFNICSRALTGHPVSAVRFDLPNARYGWLYSVYRGEDIFGGNVSPDTYFFPTATPSINNVSFVPREDYAGTFSFSYSAASTDGTTFTGTVEITVKRVTGDLSGDMSYTAYTGERMYIPLPDFSSLCQSAGLGTPNYAYFSSLPDKSMGVLYGDSGKQQVSTGTHYNFSSSSNSSHFLGSVNFLPAKVGTVSIPFVAVDTTGKKVRGTININILSGDGRAKTIEYYSTGLQVNFSRTDFAAACRDVLPAALSTVSFSLPKASEGKLYSSFKNLQSNKLLASGKQVAANDLIKITFVPKGGAEGAVYIPFSATDIKGNRCSGSVCIQLVPVFVSQCFDDLGSCPWAVPSLDFMYRYGIVNGTGGTSFSPNEAMLRRDFILMLSRTFDYPGAGTVSYADVPTNSYYSGAIASAKAIGLIPEGTWLFHPDDSLTLEDAAVFFYRALAYEGIITPADHTALLDRFADGDAVSGYAREAVGAMVYLGVFRGDTDGNLRPQAAVTRVSMAVILHRAIT